jgi:hypothetical protein
MSNVSRIPFFDMAVLMHWLSHMPVLPKIVLLKSLSISQYQTLPTMYDEQL